MIILHFNSVNHNSIELRILTNILHALQIISNEKGLTGLESPSSQI